MSGCRPKESVVRANQSCLLGDPEDVSDYRPNLEATQDVTLYGSSSLLYYSAIYAILELGCRLPNVGVELSTVFISEVLIAINSGL